MANIQQNKTIIIKTRLPQKIEEAVYKEAMAHLLRNPGWSDEQLQSTFIYIDAETGNKYIYDPKAKHPGKKFQRVRKDAIKQQKEFETSDKKFDIWILPPVNWDLWKDGRGFLNVPEYLNKWLVTQTKSRIFVDYYCFRLLYNGLDQLHPGAWHNEEIIRRIWIFIDNHYNTAGLSPKKKTRAYHMVGMLRSLCKYLGWNDNEIQKHFPQPSKGDPLKKRIANKSWLYFTEEQEKTYIETTDEVMMELVKAGEISLIHALQIMFYVRFALETGTRQGIANFWSPDRSQNLGQGILGARKSNVMWHTPTTGYANVFLQDKGSELWKHKIISKPSTSFLKNKLLPEHLKVFGAGEDRIFPSNEGLARMRSSKNAEKILSSIKDVERNLNLTKAKVNSLLDKINWRWWGKYGIKKGNPNLRKTEDEDKCTVTIRSHFFRHNWAVKGRRKKMDSYIICLIGGWTDLSTMENVYSDEEDPVVFTTVMENIYGDQEALAELKEIGLYQKQEDIVNGD